MPFGTQKLEWCGYPMVKKFDMFIRFDRIHERDGHTNTQRLTPHDDISRACIASRGNNLKNFFRGNFKYFFPWILQL